MSSLSPVGRPASASKVRRRTSPNKPNKNDKNDRKSLCSFTFADGRRCRSPRFGNHPRFCPDHARKEGRARAREYLAKDLAFFFSGDYLSACDLTVALGRLIPAVIRGDVKGKAARTVAYLAQTLLQSIHVSQHEYTNSLGSDAWRKSIRNSINQNHDYLIPPTPTPEPPGVVAGLQTGAVQPLSAQASPIQPSTSPAEPSLNCHSARPGPAGERSRPISSAVFAPPKTSACVVEESAFSSSSAPQPAEPPAVPAFPVQASNLPPEPALNCHPERSEGSQPNPATHSPEHNYRLRTDRELL